MEIQERECPCCHRPGFVYKGRYLTLKELAGEFGVPYRTVWMRYRNRGWTLMEALRAPTQENKGRRAKHYCWEGECWTLTEWASFVGMTRDVLYDRISRGWSIEKALLTPVRKQENRAND